MTRHCFTYGSLMCEEIMFAVCGAAAASTPATLAGYRRHPVADEAYPGMVPAADAHVEGVLYRDLTPAAIARLDAFEGPQYRRDTVSVRLADGSTVVDAETYVFRPEFAHLLLPGDWDFEHFLRHGRAAFEARYVGYARI